MPRHRHRPRRVCALVSGGVESAALVAALLREGHRVYPLYVNSGFRWERAERHWLKRLLRALRHPRLAPLAQAHVDGRALLRSKHWAFGGSAVPGARSADAAVYLPGRNLLLLSLAATHGDRHGVDSLALGTLAGNPFPDATPGFLDRAVEAFSTALRRKISVEAPFRLMSKDQVVSAAGELPWELTFSCLSPAGLAHCGRCNKCAERRRVLA
jgi:7-cyano-7-deazaguanine synthase